MHSRVVARLKGKEIPLGAFSASETVKGSERSWDDFALASQSHDRVTDSFGGGEKLTIIGTSGVLRKNLSVTIYDEFPNLAVFDVSYTNTGKSELTILEWNNNAYTIDAQTLQAGSILVVPKRLVRASSELVGSAHAGFSQQNYLGMNASDYGGGTPIVDVWRKDVGIGVGLVEPRPRLISLPVSMPNARQARVSVQYRHDRSLLPGESFHTFRSFVAVHERRLLPDASYVPPVHVEAGLPDGHSARRAPSARSGAPGDTGAISSRNRFTTRCQRLREWDLTGSRWMTAGRTIMATGNSIRRSFPTATPTSKRWWTESTRKDSRRSSGGRHSARFLIPSCLRMNRSWHWKIRTVRGARFHGGIPTISALPTPRVVEYHKAIGAQDSCRLGI